MNVAVVAPARTVTVAGTVALVPLAVRATAWPPVGAGPLIVTVPVEVLPPRTDDGFNERPVTTAGLTVSVADALLVPSAALIEGVAAAATAVVVTWNVADVEPASTVTVAGTVAEGSLDVSVTVVPPVGAMPVSVTVAVDAVPPITDVGLRLTEVTVGARTLKFALAEPPLNVAVNGPAVSVATAVVVTLKDVAVCPAGTVTVAGRVAAALFEVSVITAPPAGAGDLI